MDLNSLLLEKTCGCMYEVDSSAIAVAGASAGGLCAYLAVMHVSPKPRALLSLYAMGGDFLVSSPL